ncbi:MAG TPA: hypothetical protein VNY07_06180 [Chthoniobacterales bacterium]|jgi:hypothetical protein|nr:hypothetical protein [Chthoniobacterales bacterium]
MSVIGDEKLPETLGWYRQTGNWIAITASALLGVEANFLKQLGSFCFFIRSLGAASAVSLLLCVLCAIWFLVSLTKYANALESCNRRRAKLDYVTDATEQQDLLQSLRRATGSKRRAQKYYWRLFQVMLGFFALGIFLISCAAFTGLVWPVVEEPKTVSPQAIAILVPEVTGAFTVLTLPNSSDAKTLESLRSAERLSLPLNPELAWAYLRATGAEVGKVAIGEGLKFELGLGAKRGERGEPGERGAPGKDGKDCNCPEQTKIRVPSDAFF